MRKVAIATIVALILLSVPAVHYGQSMGGGKQHGMMNEQPTGQMGSVSGRQGGYGMDYQAMMGGCPMGGPMMGYGTGPGMGGGMMHGMMSRYGMGSMHSMMGGYGMGMYGPHGWSGQNREEMNAFLDQTRDLRKQMHDLRFEYGEKMRNPATTIGELQQMETRLGKLHKQIWQQYRK